MRVVFAPSQTAKAFTGLEWQAGKEYLYSQSPQLTLQFCRRTGSKAMGAPGQQANFYSLVLARCSQREKKKQANKKGNRPTTPRFSLKQAQPPLSNRLIWMNTWVVLHLGDRQQRTLLGLGTRATDLWVLLRMKPEGHSCMHSPSWMTKPSESLLSALGMLAQKSRSTQRQPSNL